MPDLPNGFDWADGVAGRLGTPKVAANVKVQSANGATTVEGIQIEEHPGSPEIERAEQATLTHRFSMPWGEATDRIQYLGRGTLLQDSFGNVTKVLSSKIQRNEMSTANLSVVTESVSFDSPPDQFQIVPVELGVNIIKHPRYFYALRGDTTTQELLNQAVIRQLQNYFATVNSAMRDSITYQMYWSIGFPGTLVGGVPTSEGTYTPSGQSISVYKIPGTDLAKRAALEIIQKYWRGEETPYVVGYQITWSAFYFRPPYLNPGGYVEDPIAEGQLPNYFWSVSYPPDFTNSIFDALAYINPQCYSSNGQQNGNVLISWLRKADQMEEQRTWFKVDRTWIGSPVGFWDSELYNAGSRPTSAADYLQIAPPNDAPTPRGSGGATGSW